MDMYGLEWNMSLIHFQLNGIRRVILPWLFSDFICPLQNVYRADYHESEICVRKKEENEETERAVSGHQHQYGFQKRFPCSHEAIRTAERN